MYEYYPNEVGFGMDAFAVQNVYTLPMNNEELGKDIC